ncbi:MAG: circularly permuted type 2 ATP-grasp protein [Candidatus Hydrogenedens sp.]|nr:circularly permuted type 2 ATP-grasp protein [Candidatus Hydrogenedens sp.]
MLSELYQTEGFFDEMMETAGKPRVGMQRIVEQLSAIDRVELYRRQREAETALHELGITFTLKSEDGDTERIFPFDLIPRIIPGKEWDWIEKGLKQRIAALNLFIQDVYHDGKIFKDKVVRESLVKSSVCYRKECEGLKVPGGIWNHVSGTDLVRDKDGQMYVLEDNMRCPSGVSYVLENRDLMKRTLPDLFRIGRVRPVEEYPAKLRQMLDFAAPPGCESPVVVVLTPGIYNSAYYEHSFLAQNMGVELVEGRDLVVHEGFVKMRTTRGLRRVDVIYRRLDDDFLDPEVFRPDSCLGVPGIMEVYKNGRVTLANAPGTGVADDKVIYSYVPDIIRYYLAEEPIIPNVPTYLCEKADDLKYVLEHLDELVVKPANASGGMGIVVGPHATKDQLAAVREAILADPREYIAQPTLSLSRVPTLCDDGFEGRHVDLRPYALHGDGVYVLPGALTRVALKKGSLIVNSSQGGGSKDTWVLAE